MSAADLIQRDTDIRCDYCRDNGFQAPNLCEDCIADSMVAPTEKDWPEHGTIEELICLLRECDAEGSPHYANSHMRRAADALASKDTALAEIRAENERLRKAVRATLTWAEQRCPCRNEEPNPCPLCGASVENLEGCKSAENTLPRHILESLRAASRAISQDGEER